MHRWRFNLKTGQTTEQYLDDEVTEFPAVSNDYVGRALPLQLQRPVSAGRVAVPPA